LMSIRVMKSDGVVAFVEPTTRTKRCQVSDARRHYWVAASDR